MAVVHLNDGGWSDQTHTYMVACATRGIDQPMRVSTVKAFTTCRRCRASVRFANYRTAPEGK